jgi:hypothetical protein
MFWGSTRISEALRGQLKARFSPRDVPSGPCSPISSLNTESALKGKCKGYPVSLSQKGPLKRLNKQVAVATY